MRGVAFLGVDIPLLVRARQSFVDLRLEYLGFEPTDCIRRQPLRERAQQLDRLLLAVLVVANNEPSRIFLKVCQRNFRLAGRRSEQRDLKEAMNGECAAGLVLSQDGLQRHRLAADGLGADVQGGSKLVNRTELRRGASLV